MYTKAKGECEHVHRQSLLAIEEELGHRRGYLFALDTLGSVYYEQGDFARAKAVFEECLQRHEPELGIADFDNFCQSQLGYAALGLGDLEAAQRHFYTALTHGTARTKIHALGGWAGLLKAQGDKKQALEILAFTAKEALEDRHTNAEKQWMTDLVADLPTDVVDAAQTRGKAFELDPLVEAVLNHQSPPPNLATPTMEP